jgi:nucleotide-binding universal stress UspA family protein
MYYQLKQRYMSTDMSQRQNKVVTAMAIKDLLVAFDGTDACVSTLKYAAQMASKYQACLTGIFVNFPIVGEQKTSRWVSKDVFSTLERAQEENISAVKEHFEKELDAAGFSGDRSWLSEFGHTNDVLCDVSRYYDMLLIGQHSSDPQKNQRVRAEELVMTTGKPILVVPAGYAVRPFKEYAAVAWDGGSRAARALTDAMQILETKKRLDVISVGTEIISEDKPDGRNILRHLRRHEIDARAVVLPRAAGGIGSTLIDYCVKNDPDVLVMGAYGHARLREDLFGGVTRQMLRTSPIPLMIAH